jgi:hypothetical protein
MELMGSAEMALRDDQAMASSFAKARGHATRAE